jgi:hypothetical protein
MSVQSLFGVKGVDGSAQCVALLQYKAALRPRTAKRDFTKSNSKKSNRIFQ